MRRKRDISRLAIWVLRHVFGLSCVGSWLRATTYLLAVPQSAVNGEPVFLQPDFDSAGALSRLGCLLRKYLFS